MSDRPLQPANHDNKCPCIQCETWAGNLIDWERVELAAGRDPWAEFKHRHSPTAIYRT